MKRLLVLAILIPGVVQLAFAQERGGEEALETLRFMRLAETKKHLPFSDEKLLKINEVLDEFEAQKFQLKRKTMRLHRQIGLGGLSDGEADKIFGALKVLRRQEFENDLALWDQMETLLLPLERIQFFRFYDRFQRDVKRRIRQLQRGNKRPGFKNRQ